MEADSSVAKQRHAACDWGFARANACNLEAAQQVALAGIAGLMTRCLDVIDSGLDRGLKKGSSDKSWGNICHPAAAVFAGTPTGRRDRAHFRYPLDTGMGAAVGSAVRGRSAARRCTAGASQLLAESTAIPLLMGSFSRLSSNHLSLLQKYKRAPLSTDYQPFPLGYRCRLTGKTLSPLPCLGVAVSRSCRGAFECSGGLVPIGKSQTLQFEFIVEEGKSGSRAIWLLALSSRREGRKKYFLGL